MKNRSINMLIVGFVLLSLMATALIFFLEDAKQRFPEDIEVKENGVTEGIMEVRDLKLHPSESREYSVNLYCEASGSYYIDLDFEETADGGLKPFIRVLVSADGMPVYSGELTELLDGEGKISFEGELLSKDDEPYVISVQYLMPYDVGNEAQGTYADFDVHITIKKS